MDKELTAIRRRAMDLLARREHSQLELQQKLLAKGFPLELVTKVLQQLYTEGLQSDTRFAKGYVRSRSERGFGPVRIEIELQSRGVAENIISNSLASGAEFWNRVAARVREKKFGNAELQDLKERNCQYTFLQYRGFTSEQIKAVFNDA